MRIIASLVLAAVGMPSISFSASPPLQWSELGQQSFSAFQCSVFAMYLDESQDQSRLFDIGYDSGRTLARAVLSGEIERVDYPDAPIAVVVLLSGPSADFVLGRIYESASQAALQKIAPSPTATPEHQRKNARQAYANRNCRLIGR